jgi:hypothetical protein
VEYSALFKKLAGIMGKKIFLVIDALDECSDNVGYLCSELRSIGGADNFSCQMLVSSRPHDTIENAMQSVRCKVLMKEHNGPDIRLKVERGLAHVPGLSSPEERFACDKISEKAEGEFSYVNTAINILMQPWRRSSNGRQRSLEDVMEKLPTGMHGSYQLIFERLDPVYIELAKTCLNWALLCEGEITVAEVMDAYNAVFSNVNDGHQTSSTTPDKNQQEMLAEQMDKASGAFIEIDKKTEVWNVKLRHASVKDHFLPEPPPKIEKPLEPSHLCDNCRSHLDRKPAFFIRKKEGHLALAITLCKSTVTFLYV